MVTNVVKFTTIDQVQKFVDGVRKMPYDVNAGHGKYTVDAKSILGILSLSLGKEIKIDVMCDPEEESAAQEALNALCESL